MPLTKTPMYKKLCQYKTHFHLIAQKVRCAVKHHTSKQTAAYRPPVIYSYIIIPYVACVGYLKAQMVFLGGHLTKYQLSFVMLQCGISSYASMLIGLQASSYIIIPYVGLACVGSCGAHIWPFYEKYVVFVSSSCTFRSQAFELL